MVQVEKPVPKPRTKLPNSTGVDTHNDRPIPSPRTSTHSQLAATSSLPVGTPAPYGWNQHITTVDKGERDSPLSTTTSSSSINLLGSPAPPPSSAPSPCSTLSISPCLSNAIPQPSAHFIPLGPAPPIPPRLEKDKPLPEPIDESLFSSSENDYPLPEIPKASPDADFAEVYGSLEDDQPIYDTIAYDTIESLCSSRQSSISRSDYYGSSHYLQAAVDTDVLAPAPKRHADGEIVSFNGLSKWTLGKKGKVKGQTFIRNKQILLAENELMEHILQGPYDLSRLLYVGVSSENASDLMLILRSPNQGKVPSCKGEVIKFAPLENYKYWVALLAKCNAPECDLLRNSLTEIEAGGNIYIKDGITNFWKKGFLFVANGIINLMVEPYEEIKKYDIRKVTNILMNIDRCYYCNHISHSNAGPVAIIMENNSVYFQNENDGATQTWYKFFQLQLRRSTTILSECRVTNDNVPVIVDKCMKFVATYGMKQAGIYRRNGQTTEARRVFDALKNDPHTAVLSFETDETINAVADVLRTFFRQLESPLIPIEIQPKLYYICEQYKQLIGSPGNSLGIDKQLKRRRNEEYKAILQQLDESGHVVNYATLKKLVEHLVAISAHAHLNLASVDNLARIFGPTIFVVDKMQESPSNFFMKTGLQIGVMTDFLLNAESIFDTTAGQDSVQITKSFEERSANVTNQGYLIPVHLFEKDNQCFNVRPGDKAEDVIENRIKKFETSSVMPTYALYEVIKGDTLERRVGDKETINSIALERWTEWGAADAYLILKKETYAFNPANTRPFAEDIKICTPGSKSFKTAQLRIDNGKTIQQFPQGEKLGKPRKEWGIDETVWFIGSIPERKCPEKYPYPTTFFLKEGKYNSKLAGFCVAFAEETQRDQWLNAVFACQRDYSPIVLVPDL